MHYPAASRAALQTGESPEHTAGTRGEVSVLGKSTDPPPHHLVGYFLRSALETIRSHPKIVGSSSCPGCAAHGCCFAGGFPPRPLELALPWGQWAGRERPGLKAFISPVWINLACPWPCPDHWAARAASGTKPGGRLEAKWPRARCSQEG